MGRLEGKAAVVTGGAAGIGAAIGRRFASEGAKVLLVDLDEGALRKTAAEIGPQASVMVADVTKKEDTDRFVSEAVRTYGKVDIAVLNAGIEGDYGTISELPVSVFDKVMAVNVRGVWLGLAAMFPIMKDAGGGSIVVMSSVGGFRGTAGWAAYAASKHAVIGLMKSAALEGAPHKIRVNSVHPAPVQSRMIQAIDGKMRDAGIANPTENRAARIPLKRYGEPEEVASMVLYLASDESNYCTAGTYLVDGGAMTG